MSKEDAPKGNRATYTPKTATMESIEAMNSLFDDFHATHRHARGGLYQVLDTSVKVQLVEKSSGGDVIGWVPAVRYRNDKGEQFVRARGRFEERFKPWVSRGADRRVQQRGWTSAEKRHNGERREVLNPAPFQALEEVLAIKEGWLHERALKIDALEGLIQQVRRISPNTNPNWSDAEVISYLESTYKTFRRDYQSALETVPPKYRAAMGEKVVAQNLALEQPREDNTRKGHKILDLQQQLATASGINFKLREELRQVTLTKNSHWAAYVGADAMMQAARERETMAHANLRHERTVVRREERLSYLHQVRGQLLDAGLRDAANMIELMIAKEH